MTTIKHSYPGQWGSIPTATERDEADEFHDVERMNRWFPALGWAIGVVAVFGCMLAGWYAS